MRVGFIGWRGMVGSVLLERMQACGDFKGLDPTFFSTSAVGGQGPTLDGHSFTLQDAYDLDALERHEVLVSCQGSDYTDAVHDKLRSRGWNGYFIDADVALRMRDETVLILDPVNRDVIDRGLTDGIKTFCGANCTVSLMLMALQGLFRAGHVEWLSSMTYQAASGGGAREMRELVAQMAFIGDGARELLADPAASALAIDASVSRSLADDALPTAAFGVPLAGSLIPWISRDLGDGQSREEWKGHVEGNKILGGDSDVPIDGVCVRIGAMRCHAQAFTIKLNSDVPLDEVCELIGSANDWVRVIDNEKAASIAALCPAEVGGKLEIPIGRLRQMRMGPRYLSAFTVGDQLLWGAAEPLRRMLEILRQR